MHKYILPPQNLLGDFIPKPLLRFALNKGFRM